MKIVHRDSSGKVLRWPSGKLMEYSADNCCWQCIYRYGCFGCPKRYAYLKQFIWATPTDFCCDPISGFLPPAWSSCIAFGFVPLMVCAADTITPGITWCTCQSAGTKDIVAFVAADCDITDPATQCNAPPSVAGIPVAVSGTKPCDADPPQCNPCDYEQPPGDTPQPKQFKVGSQCTWHWGSTYSVTDIFAPACDDLSCLDCDDDWNCDCVNASPDIFYRILSTCIDDDTCNDIVDEALSTPDYAGEYCVGEGISNPYFYGATCPSYYHVQFSCKVMGSGALGWHAETLVALYGATTYLSNAITALPSWATTASDYCQVAMNGHSDCMRVSKASTCNTLDVMFGPCYNNSDCSKLHLATLAAVADRLSLTIEFPPTGYWLPSSVKSAIESDCDITCTARQCCVWRWNTSPCGWSLYSETITTCTDCTVDCTVPGTLYYTGADGWKYYSDTGTIYAVKCNIYSGTPTCTAEPPYPAYSCCRSDWNTSSCTWGTPYTVTGYCDGSNCTCAIQFGSTELYHDSMGGWYYCRSSFDTYYAVKQYTIQDQYGCSGSCCDASHKPTKVPAKCCYYTWDTVNCDWDEGTHTCDKNNCACFGMGHTQLHTDSGWYYCRDGFGNYYAHKLVELDGMGTEPVCSAPTLDAYCYEVAEFDKCSGFMSQSDVCAPSGSYCGFDYDGWQMYDNSKAYRFREIPNTCSLSNKPTDCTIGSGNKYYFDIASGSFDAAFSFLEVKWTLSCNISLQNCRATFSGSITNGGDTWDADLYYDGSDWVLDIAKQGASNCKITWKSTSDDFCVSTVSNWLSYDSCVDTDCSGLCTTYPANISITTT